MKTFPLRRLAFALKSIVWHHRDSLSLSEINVRLLNGALINWNWNGSPARPVAFRKHHRQSRAPSSGRWAPSSRSRGSSEKCHSSAPWPNLEFCLPHLHSKWKSVELGTAPRKGARDDHDDDGNGAPLSIRRIQSPNLSIYYSVIQWLILTWGIWKFPWCQ